MKNIKRVLLIIVSCLILCLAISLKADSGWDGDYDYDYGSSDWDFDWGNDYGSSSNNHYHKNTTSSEDVGAALIALGIFIIMGIGITVLILSQASKSKTKTNILSNTNNISGFDINKIKEILPNFNVQEFRQKTYEIYKNIQNSWMNFDHDELKKYTTNELYNLYKSELNALKIKKQKNIMSDFNLESFNIIDMEKGNNNISIKVRMTVSCLDYVVNKNEEVIRGNKLRKVVYNYEMTFTKGLEEKDNKCPNCNAPLDNVTTSICPYCNSTVISSNHEWVLSKKQMISQRMK